MVLLPGALVLLSVWIRVGTLWWAAAAAVLLVAALAVQRPAHRLTAFASGLLVLMVASAFLSQWDLRRFSESWPERLASWEMEIQDHLARDLDRALRAAESSAERLAAGWVDGWDAEAPILPPGLLGPDVQAVAVFGREGRLLAWDGKHQGPFPDDARFGADRYLYREGALFGYLYVTHPLPEGRGVVAVASLFRADLPPGLDEDLDDLQSRFAADRGGRIRISRPERVRGESVWDFRWEGRTLFSVTLDPRSEAEDLAVRAMRWERFTALGLLAAWLALLLAGRGGRGVLIPAATLPALLFALPLGRLLGAPDLFSPTGLLLPFVPGVTLGDLLAFGAAFAFLLGVVPAVPASRGARWLAPAAAVAAALALMGLMNAGASRDLLVRGEREWIAFQTAATVLVGLLFALALFAAHSDRERARIPLLVAGPVLALLFVSGGVLQVRAGPEIPVFAGALWVLPLLALAHSLPSVRRWEGAVMRLVLAMVLGATLVLPWAWSLRVEGRMTLAEERIERLSTRPDPFLEFLLLRAGEMATETSPGPDDAIEVLYDLWARSGLASEGVPAWLTFWSANGRPAEDLRIGVETERPGVSLDLVDRAMAEGGVRVRRFDLADVHYVMAAPLPDGGAISILVPPRRTLEYASPLGPLFSPARGDPDPLVLIPLLPGEAPGATEGIDWERAPHGWQGELYLVYPDEVYHAHYLIELPGNVLLLARGILLLLLALVPALLLWVAGRRVGEDGPLSRSHFRPWFTSFRGRVTVALFTFFLLPSFLFGTLAYRTLSGAATRTAGVLAERAVKDAADWFTDTGGSMELLARRTGLDLLLYDGGELVSGSFREMVDLGLYEGWMPPEVYRLIAQGEGLTMTTSASLGGWEYVVAYRRTWGGQMLAAPAPLAAGATALRQRDVADLIGFAVVLGAAMSVLLSLIAGRALARPIQTLRIASERVGAGNMGVQLDANRGDEFGAVFGAFNRMVDRLGRTRRELERSARRTRAIMEEVATGIIALDQHGRVTLANTRAEDLLGIPLGRGRSIPADGTARSAGPTPPGGRTAHGAGPTLAEWVDAYMLRDGRDEATELQMGDRRIRVRARRVRRRGPPGGVVLSLEDVTDELRTERILAWGEMARQVAHEVKNPLTPIKLGIQHIQRAHHDRSPEFGEILDRNVEAILREIDRLAGISSSFSRFGAPSPLGSGPTEPVRIQSVVNEVLTLYEPGHEMLRVVAVGLDDLPAVSARPGELKEVLVNLLENARGALPSGGEVVLKGEAGPEYVTLSVEDDGEGMAPELLARVFEPHFSTRSGGSGLGLAIVQRLVESWGGRVRASSIPGEGTSVVVEVPRWIPTADGPGG